MIDIEALPEDLRVAVNGRDFILFDGECVLCSGFFRFIVRHDAAQRFSFVLAQSELGQRLYQALDLSPTAFETNLVCVDGHIYQRLDSFAAAMRALGPPWASLRVLRFLPSILKDPAYRLIARNRYRLFGRYDSCMIPDAGLRARFIDLEVPS